MRPSIALFTKPPHVPFVPRTSFTVSQDIPRNYFLGHHREGLERMKEMLPYVDVIIECRDFRVPHTSVNPLFEQLVKDKQRIIVFTKRDLGGDFKLPNQKKEKCIISCNKPSKVFFQTRMNRVGLLPILKWIRAQPIANPAVGMRILVVGMPNVGKSTLLNSLRLAALPKDERDRKKHNVARVGNHPGVTRKIGSPVKLLDKKAGPVYIYDTPGVFVPHISEPEDMVKLTLCGIVKENIVSPITLADYILYHINQFKPYGYAKIHPPTNDIMEFLTAFAKKRSLLSKGGVPNIERAARAFVHLYNQGDLYYFIMDDVHAIHKKWVEQRRELKEKEAKEQAKAKAVEDSGAESSDSTTIPAEGNAQPAGEASELMAESNADPAHGAKPSLKAQEPPQSVKTDSKVAEKQTSENAGRNTSI